MIDDKVMNTILPLPSLEDSIDELKSDLAAQNFPITNFSSGGVFYTLLAIVVNIKLELIALLRKVVNKCFVTHAEDDWIELKAAD